MAKKITKTAVDAAKPKDKDSFLWDSQVKGFGLKVTPGGRKVYILQARLDGRLRRFTIGTHGSPWTAEQARKEAMQMLARVAAGEDPAALKKAFRSDISVSELCRLYLNEGCEGKKATTIQLDHSRIGRHIVPLLGARRVKTLTRADIERFMADVASGKTANDQRTECGRSIVRGGKGIASRTMGLLGAILQFAVNRGLRGDNPVRGIKRYSDRRIDRFLSSEELSDLAGAITCAEQRGENSYAVAAVRFLLLTGVRKGEALKLRWDWIDWERSCIWLPDSKTGNKIVPLGRPAVDLLDKIERVKENPYVFVGSKEGSHFVGLQKVWERIRNEAGLNDLRLHDLRHHFISVGASAGESLYILGKIAGHKHAATTQRYAHLADDPVKNAANYISKLVNASLERAGEIE